MKPTPAVTLTTSNNPINSKLPLTRPILSFGVYFIIKAMRSTRINEWLAENRINANGFRLFANELTNKINGFKLNENNTVKSKETSKPQVGLSLICCQ